MATIRILADVDVGAVAALFMRIYPDHGWESENACAAYFRDILFDNPWHDPQVPSWVAVDDGEIVACYAVMARRMILNGRPIRVAVGCQFLVDAKRCDGRVWLQLAKACMSGPQDLTLADGANEFSRRMWTAVGGAASLLYSLHWTRPLRPAGYTLSLLEERGAMPRALRFAVRPIASAIDALAARLRPNRFNRTDPGIVEQGLDAATMHKYLPDAVKGYALRPDYRDDGLPWLLRQAAHKTRHGKLRARAVFKAERPIGWYLYYVSPGKIGEVLQIVAFDNRFDAVLRCLLVDAWRQGATALRGRFDPRSAQALSDQYCWLRREGPWTLIQSRDETVMAALQQGDAFLSRLEGEWWMRFIGG